MSHVLRGERKAMNRKDKVDIRYKNDEEGQQIVVQGSTASVHAGLLILMGKIAESLDATIPDVLECLGRMHELGEELFTQPPVTKMTPMERFLHEMNKPLED